uniref:SKI-interacting protein SKIP SNW domain-containing protein n=1 Tax=Strombidinopsis acuminata TaxID=141414 RepID=A0A7S3TIY6_9SPIT
MAEGEERGSGSLVRRAPPQGQRKGWIPRSQADFADGGAFPEVHVAQFPLEMGRKGGRAQAQTLALTTDGSGRPDHAAAIASVGQRAGKIVHAGKDSLAPKVLSEEELARPDDEAAAENTERTRLALEALASSKVSGAHGSLEKALADKKPAQYIRYTPSNQGSAHAAGATNRVIRMVEAPVDPLEPPKFKHKRVPRGPPSPPVPVMHSPPRKISAKDQQDWKIPPCISNWKNIKGYTIPLDKRLAADGRNLQEVQISDNFAKLSEALYIAERNAREEVEKRADIQRRLAAKDKERKEEELRALAMAAREERLAPPPPTALAGGNGLAGDDDDEVREREELRKERKRERERERRLENKDGKRSRMSRDAERDVSERIALGQTVPTASETLYDQRLFNQAGGVASGFGGGDDAYNIYDKALFKSGAAAESIYRPTATKEDEWGDEDTAEAAVMKAARFKGADRGFEGAGEQAAGGAPSGPRQFVQDDAEADPFGLDEFLTEAKSGRPLDRVGQSSGMAAAAGGSMGESGRSRINFEREGGRR